ncbi:MAG TPA: thiol-disulfide oxidoreductase DCC family protein [Paludibacter sp.]|nr:thiol-disulfide oxidoreductase DCC family protein [Paludibacter sp.]
MHQSPVILFDGICNLCCGWVRFLIRRDKNRMFRFASIQSDAGKKLLDSAGLSHIDPETIVYLKDKQFYQESSAVLEILSDLGGIWKITTLFRLIPKAVRNGIYRFIARNRYRIFGARSSCLMPTPENAKRFLL